ncbi:hypothetical protein N7495_002072 [Penicillium taxi]|uniref:uncharacterized protein n=1 Tax=Penicillium taxi TaxID=168475 RepID=UPI0025453248|nr:uncharacterized protein N7495_002072 [Penicillium taxi]KAJ5901544.1 hypothetical protein N7495_002072 [Penicillium taxi]
MSLSSPKKKNGGNTSGQRQIRFVSTDGQPQTKRRRVNAAYTNIAPLPTAVLPVAGAKSDVRENNQYYKACKTCSDYKHVCLGYSESTAHLRSQPDSTSRMSGSNDRSKQHSSQLESYSPDSKLAPTSIPQAEFGEPPVQKTSDAKEPQSSLNESARMNKEFKSQVVDDSPKSNHTSVTSSNRTHVPYFRYFGRTAIVPGFKQMVVQVRGSRKSNPSMSSGQFPPLITVDDKVDLFQQLLSKDSNSPLRSPKLSDALTGINAVLTHNHDSRDANTIPFYDRDDTLPVSNLVSHLSDLFFDHLGCNFPFLQRGRFLEDLNEKNMDTMLVDAVCALAARFSPHPLLGAPQAPSIDDTQPPTDIHMWNRGLPFAHRAMSAVVDSLSCPTLSAVQACLLLAYEQFGTNHDSGLWMYLGISIRMAQDLGLQKHQGLKHNYGQKGVTPSEVMTGQAGKLREDQYDDLDVYQSPQASSPVVGGERARERERVDSFWSIFFLDRVISSGTGRPVTLRDKDIELCFPIQSESQLVNGWPAPFPPLIRIIHLYGRVTDLINGIQDVNHVTPDTLQRLAGMESDLTGIYQRLSPRLHFNAANFQEYVKAQEGTNFILLHFWFHTLIVLLHQPTLLNSFGGTIQHLYPNSRELSMSSAKTIADILSFAELVDGKSFIGNPFTSQPMYIAACAFLMESAYYASPSRSSSPPPQPLLTNQSSGFVMPAMESLNGPERKSAAKHILLASVARENYQRCYKALKALNTYWKGTRYILTVLDQKAKGIVDPLLYTVEDMENTAANTPAPAGWLGGRILGDSMEAPEHSAVADIPSHWKWSPNIDPSQAIGWALTGTTNSSQPNLSVLYQMPTAEAETESGPSKLPYSPHFSQNYSIPVPTTSGPSASSSFHQTSGSHEEAVPSSLVTNAKFSQTSIINPDSPYYMGMNAPFVDSTNQASLTSHTRYNQSLRSTPMENPQPYTYPISSAIENHDPNNGQMGSRKPDIHSMGSHGGGMMIESHDVDMNSLQQQESQPLSNDEILPWLEYLPQELLGLFGDQQSFPLMSPDDTSQPPA